MSAEISIEMRNRAYRMCKDYLHGAWKSITDQDMIIKHISGGLSNLLYYCALPPSATTVKGEPAEVLVRFYGQVHGEESLEPLLAESVIFTLLSERGLGPRLYGIFPGGRLEQYIPARSLLCEELADPLVSREIASKMARIHALNVPISKEPTWIWSTMQRWLKSTDEFLSQPPSIPPSSSHSDPQGPHPPDALRQRLLDIPFKSEMEFMRRIINRIQSPVVFAHNDMQEGNILYNSSAKSLQQQISLIDFEYCSYNYRGFDLANHFCEWVFSYKLPTPPFFVVKRHNFPTRDQQLNFIRSYLSSYEAACGRKPHTPSEQNNSTFSCNPFSSLRRGTVRPLPPSPHDGEPFPLPPHPAEEVLMTEVKVFTLASHLFWALWSVVQGHVSTIPFGYLEYAMARLENYYDDKKQLNTDELLKRKELD